MDAKYRRLAHPDLRTRQDTFKFSMKVTCTRLGVGSEYPRLPDRAQLHLVHFSEFIGMHISMVVLYTVIMNIIYSLPGGRVLFQDLHPEYYEVD